MQRKINLIKNIFVSNFKRLSSPYKVTFAVTYKCNLKCKICGIWENKETKQELSLDAIEKIFRKLKNLSWLDLTGGEITLKENILEIVKAILKNSKKILIFHISSNGQFPDRALLLAKELLKSGLVPIINISLDGPEKINDLLRGKPGAYQHSLETFLKIRSLKKIHCYLSCTISNLNINYIDELLSDLKKNIVDFNFADLHFNLFHNSEHYYHNQNLNAFYNLPLERIKKYLSLCKRGNPAKIFLEKEYIRGFTKFYRDNKVPLRCQALSSTCFINPYGTLYPCSIYNKPIANLEDCNYDLNKLWNSKNVVLIRRGIKEGNCPHCWSPCEAYPAILGNILRRYGQA